jgi:hypothetical protein
MEIVKHGFSLKSEILDISSIQPGGSGVLQNGNAYKASVKFKCVNVYESQKLGTIGESEDNITYKIVCDDENEVITLTEFIRNKRSLKSPIYVSHGLPKLSNPSKASDGYVVNCFESMQEFIANNGGKKQDASLTKV